MPKYMKSTVTLSAKPRCKKQAQTFFYIHVLVIISIQLSYLVSAAMFIKYFGIYKVLLNDGLSGRHTISIFIQSETISCHHQYSCHHNYMHSCSNINAVFHFMMSIFISR